MLLAGSRRLVVAATGAAPNAQHTAPPEGVLMAISLVFASNAFEGVLEPLVEIV
jgi:hypothetical protein